jgi:hypothetical protein
MGEQKKWSLGRAEISLILPLSISDWIDFAMTSA